MEDTIEIWKPVVGYEGLYEVSNFGRVRSLGFYMNNRYGTKTYRDGRVLSLEETKSGYLRVRLYKDKTSRKYAVHRLVAQAFIPNPNNLPEVNHKGENKADNRAENLEWCDRVYNANYGTAIERQAAKAKNRTDLSKPVIQLETDGTFVKRWVSIREAERSGIASKQNIIAVLRNPKRKTAGGYRWIYESGH